MNAPSIPIVYPTSVPIAYKGKTHTRGMIGLATHCAVTLAVDMMRTGRIRDGPQDEIDTGWETAYRLLLDSLRTILPKHTASDRQTIARKWLLRHT